MAFSDHQLRVELDEVAIRQLGLSVSDIASKLSRQNIKLPSGNIELADRNLLIRFDEQKITPETIARTVVGADAQGAVLRLGDVATITDRFALDEQKVLFDGVPSAMLRISKNKADDALRIKERVAAFVEAENQRAPTGVNPDTDQ